MEAEVELMGRGKRKDGAENRESFMALRVNADERKQAEQIAERLGLSLSDLVRKVVRDKAQQLGLI